MGVRLNLGCGDKLLKGYVNCDLEDNHTGTKPDVACDIRELPFEKDYADEIMVIHSLEHFAFWEHENMMREWKRVLKPGGVLAVEVPCMDKVIQHFLNTATGPVAYNLTWGALYGDNSFPRESMLHKWCFSQKQLIALFEETGYENVEQKPVQYHIAARDMRVEGKKPEVKDG